MGKNADKRRARASERHLAETGCTRHATSRGIGASDEEYKAACEAARKSSEISHHLFRSGQRSIPSGDAYQLRGSGATQAVKRAEKAAAADGRSLTSRQIALVELAYSSERAQGGRMVEQVACTCNREVEVLSHFDSEGKPVYCERTVPSLAKSSDGYRCPLHGYSLISVAGRKSKKLQTRELRDTVATRIPVIEGGQQLTDLQGDKVWIEGYESLPKRRAIAKPSNLKSVAEYDAQVADRNESSKAFAAKTLAARLEKVDSEKKSSK